MVQSLPVFINTLLNVFEPVTLVTIYEPEIVSVSDTEIFALPTLADATEGMTILTVLKVPVELPVIVPETVSVPLMVQVTAAEKLALPLAFMVSEVQEEVTLILTVCPAAMVTLSEAPGVPFGVQMVVVFQFPDALLT